MSEKNMPAVEVDDMVRDSEISTYELAFHVLPTIAEGEVETVFNNLKDIITKHGAITIEEAPARFDLAYEIVKYLEGRNRKFTSAYFGWVRFTASASEIEEIEESIVGIKELLRHLLVKLTKLEEANPFYFHKTLAEKKVQFVQIDDEVEVEGVESEVAVVEEEVVEAVVDKV
jgi:ribosomal protein S6